METIHVVGAAIRDGNRVLAAQRSPRMNPPLKWEFVGGKIEKNETHREALEREVYEELGIRIKAKEFIAEGTLVAGEKKVILYVYSAIIVDGIPVAREHSQIRWVEIDKLMELDWAEPDIPACKQLVKSKTVNS
ncbi:MAG: (deoxy)nucleoside triphosphate pyrophosphohydrolase [Bacillota bacterium]